MLYRLLDEILMSYVICSWKVIVLQMKNDHVLYLVVLRT